MTKRRKHAARATPATPEAYGAATAPATVTSSGGPPAAPRARRAGRWRRWLLIGVGLILALRIALTLATPLIVKSALEAAGLHAEYEDLSLSLLGGSVELTGLELRPMQPDGVAPPGAEPAPAEVPLRLALLRVNLGMLSLLHLDTFIEEATIAGLRVDLRRSADGSLHVSGLSLPTTETPPEPPSEGPAPLIATRQLKVDDVVVTWTDDTLQPPVTSSLRLDLTGQDLQWGPGAGTGQFDLALQAAGDGERIALLGSLRGDPDNLALDGRLELGGWRAGPLMRYLPPGVVAELQEGQAEVQLRAAWTRSADGGGAAEVELSGLDVHDAGGPSQLGFDTLRVYAPRLDAEAGVFELSDVVLMGLRGRARIDSSGTLHVLGLALGAAPVAAASAPPGAEPPADESERAEATGTPPSTADRPPRVSLERLDLELAEFTWLDERHPGATPLVAGLRLQNRDPLRLLDAVPEELPPLRLLLTGRALPVAQQLSVELEASPWASPATLTVGLDVRGLRGEGLTALQPELAATLDGSGLSDGRLSAQLRAELELRRRGPAEFDLSQGFGARLELHDLALRESPEGRVLAGLNGLELEAPRIDPDGGLVHVRALELDTPQVSLRRDAAGLHLAGLLLRAPEPAAAPAPEPAPEAVAPEPPDGEPAAASPEPAVAGPELRVDRFAIHGLDLAWRDETSTPPCVFALNALEVEVRRFTTLAFVEPKTIRFDLFLGASEIELPRQSKSSSVLAGVVSAAALAVTGDEDEPATESRPAFGEVTVNGALRFVPAPTGNVRCNVAGLELLSLAGPAAAAGVEIGDGLFDAKLMLECRGTEGVDLDGRFVFTDLSVAEPAGGPISTYLKLPAPLDSVLFLLRNERGEHRIAFDLSVPPEGVGGGRLAASAGEAIGAVITRAVAAVPARMLTSVTDLVGVTGGEEGPPEPVLSLTFSPGSTALPEVSLRDLRNTLTKLRASDGAVLALEHRLGRADLARADQLGNPSIEQCRAHGAQLRQQRAELLRRQAESSAEARALLLVGQTDEAESARARLIETEQQLCLTEAALDNVYERLRPGAERYREQRARTAALQIGQARLEALQRALLAMGLPAVEDRIELRPPRLDPIEGEGGGTVRATLKGE